MPLKVGRSMNSVLICVAIAMIACSSVQVAKRCVPTRTVKLRVGIPGCDLTLNTKRVRFQEDQNYKTLKKQRVARDLRENRETTHSSQAALRGHLVIQLGCRHDVECSDAEGPEYSR
eukprot:719488-Amphidinium_carterae.1